MNFFKISLVIIFVSLSTIVMANKNTWQGTLYPNGCLSCVKEYLYSPLFKSFKECKEWANSKIKSSQDKASGGLNCKYKKEEESSQCEVVVRSWFIPLLPEYPTFENYKK